MAELTGAVVAKSWNRLDGVDLIRGLSILFVLMNHVHMQLLFAHVLYTKNLPAQLVSSLVWNGQYGVQMFFAVSGFLITATSLRRWGSLGAVRPRDFYLLRFARIAPLFLLLLLILSALHLAHVKPFIIRSRVASLGSVLLSALTFRVNVLEANHGYLPGNWDILWSLSVEEMFYLFFPVVCVLLKKTNLFLAVLLVFVVLGPFARAVFAHGNEVWHEYSYLGAMDAIALGGLTALLLARFRPRAKAKWFIGIVGALCASGILLLSAKTQDWGLKKCGIDMTILAVGTCMLTFVAAETGWKAPRLLAPMTWLGRRSYEIYLSHMFVVLTLFGFYLQMGKPRKAVPVVSISVIVVAGVLGEMLARFYSEPLNKLLRALFKDDGRNLGSILSDAHAPAVEPLAKAGGSRKAG